MVNLIKCGFFPEGIPQHCFDTKDVVELIGDKDFELDSLERNHKDKSIVSTPCHFISSYKNDLERRIIGLPHIETYMLLCSEIEKNVGLISAKFDFNIHSYSNEIYPYEIEDYVVKSTFYNNYLDRTKYSLGYKYLLKVDLSKCYENIYTHSLTWSLLGKISAKQEVKKKPKDRSEEYIKYDNLDTKLRAINNNETKGIPTGPLTSRVVSEIVLTEVDKEISKIHNKFKRYVDDYNFFFRTRTEAEEFIPKLQNILYDYKLHINSGKTEILKYPYSINHNLSIKLGKYDFEKNTVLDYIERFNELYALGNKGALKFGLKVLKSKQISKDEDQIVFSHLINLMITYPNLAEYIFTIFDNNEFTFTDETAHLLNDILLSCVKNVHQVEAVWLLTVMLYFDIDIYENIILLILEKVEVFSTILVLDGPVKFSV